MRIIYLIFTIIVFSIQYTYSQKYTITGYIDDADTGEKLIGATIYNRANTSLGTITNFYGFYSISLPAGTVKFTASFVGYQSYFTEFVLSSDTIINIKLKSSILLDQVDVLSNKSDSKVESSQMGNVEIPVKTIKSLPVILGETDVLKVIQLLPGVKSGTEGTSGFYVRGGGPDQNLILLDGVPVYNVNHLFGFFSVFNADAINSVTLVKGGFPARYGGRLSSVLDIRMKEGSMKKIKADGSVGIIATRLTIDGPIIKDKTSFIISARRTYIDALAQPFIIMYMKRFDVDDSRFGYYFYDVNAKVNHVFSHKDRLYLSVYTGRDKAYFRINQDYNDGSSKNKFDLIWGNITTALRWNHVFSKKIFGNVTATYSRYKFETNVESASKDQVSNTSNKYSLEYFSGIEDYAVKVDFDYMPNPNHLVKFGGINTYHTFMPGVNAFKAKIAEEDTTQTLDMKFGNKNIHSNEYAFYLEDDIKIGQSIKINAGLHYSGFYVRETFYQSLQPRLSARYRISQNISAKAAFTQMNQYLHLLSNSGIGLPTDLWLPVTDKIKPQVSYQYAVGTTIHVFKYFDITLEGYYKTMDKLIEYKPGASYFSLRNSWEEKLEIGEGKSYGTEILIEKSVGKLTGWIGYTLSWSKRKFENLNFGKTFPYRYDRRHDIGIAITYKFNDKVDAGIVWVYSTGNAITLGTQKYAALSSDDYYYNMIDYYDQRNGFRMPSYHRLDIGFNFTKPKRWGTRSWNIGFYNAYNRKNPFFVDFEQKKNKMILVQYSLFPIIPSISYTFKFK